MIFRVTSVALLVAFGALPLRGADEAPKSRMKDVLKARIAEDAKKVEPGKSAPAASAATSGTDTRTPEATTTGTPEAKTPGLAKPEQKRTASEPPTVLPKVEVKKGRITELDQQLAKQEQAIARERKNLKTSEVDAALNDTKIARPLSIFGGESSQFRKRVASERVELMEAEKDLIEAIARAKTKAGKQELQKQLDELKAFRRELDKSLR
ncbi:MAG: hypothetical protein ACREH8_19085 [Opitutaceae bacterium]